MTERGRVAFGENRLKRLNRVLKKDPRSFEANFQLGLFYYKKGEIPKAVPFLERAADANGEKAELFFVLANAYKSLKDPEKSEHFFRRAISLQPENPEFHYHYGLMLHESNRNEDAVEALNRALELRPDHHEILNDLGVIHYQRKRYQEAVSCFQKALALRDDYVLARVNLAYVYLAMEDYASASKIAEKLAADRPHDPDVILLGRQLQALYRAEPAQIPDIDTELSFSDRFFQITPLKIVRDFREKVALERIGLSVVVPVFNERENIPILYRELNGVLEELKEGYEIIFVDDGSSDGSRDLLQEIARGDDRVRVIQFRKNYGQTAALHAGFQYSRGGVVVTLDGDLQNDPADIPRLLQKMAEGYDLVSGWRQNRRDKWLTRRLPSRIANWIINKLIEGTGVQLNDFGCTLKAYKRGVIKNIHLYGEMHRFIPVFAAWLGVKIAEIPVNHRPRIHGCAKYNLSRVSRVIFDLVVVRFFSDYMTRPIQFFGRIAGKLAAGGLAAIAGLTCLSLFAALPISINTLVVLVAILFVAILQIISMGLLGEIMIRSYFEGQNKQSFVVERIIGDGCSG